MIDWLLPVIGFVVVTGLLGVTTKLALTRVTWQQLIVWTAVAYAVLSIGVIAIGVDFSITANRGTGLAVLNGVVTPVTFILLFTALRAGDVSRVVPIGASYPVVTVLAAALLLDEPLTVTRTVGTLLVVAGIVLVSTESRFRPRRAARGQSS